MNNVVKIGKAEVVMDDKERRCLNTFYLDGDPYGCYLIKGHTGDHSYSFENKDRRIAELEKQCEGLKKEKMIWLNSIPEKDLDSSKVPDVWKENTALKKKMEDLEEQYDDYWPLVEAHREAARALNESHKKVKGLEAIKATDEDALDVRTRYAVELEAVISQLKKDLGQCHNIAKSQADRSVDVENQNAKIRYNLDVIERENLHLKDQVKELKDRTEEKKPGAFLTMYPGSSQEQVKGLKKKVEWLEYSLHDWKEIATDNNRMLSNQNSQLKKEIEGVRSELERERVRLAGAGCAALGYAGDVKKDDTDIVHRWNLQKKPTTEW